MGLNCCARRHLAYRKNLLNSSPRRAMQMQASTLLLSIIPFGIDKKSRKKRGFVKGSTFQHLSPPLPLFMKGIKSFFLNQGLYVGTCFYRGGEVAFRLGKKRK